MRTGAGEWVEAQFRGGRTLTPFQHTAVEVLAEGMNTGPWNLSVNWQKVDWRHGGGVAFTMYSGGLATFDGDHLTRLVLAAHERGVRVCIAPCAPRYLRISIHPRKREGDFASRHPTIEDAIAKFGGGAA